MLILKTPPSLFYLEAASSLLAAFICYGIGLAIYRIYFSPLSKFPGPKLSAATLWYEFYYDVVKRGKFAWEIKRMHEIYGPVVRINPHEVHVNVPEFYDVLYTAQMRKKRNKYQRSVSLIPSHDATIATVNHDVHRKRRTAMAPYFSPQSIRKFEPVVKEKLEIFNKRADEYRASKQPLNLVHSLTALASDIVSEYCFGMSFGFLDVPDFYPEWTALVKGASEHGLLSKQMPWLKPLLRKLPISWVHKFKPEAAQLLIFQERVSKRLRDTMSGSPETRRDDVHPTIFYDILESNLPPSELMPERLQGEGEVFLVAGSITTGHYLTTAFYHILSNPQIHQKLNEELIKAMPDPAVVPPYQDLVQLPYFAAVITEGFRLSHGVITRLPRIAPDEDFHVAGFTIAAGTPVSMSSWLLHMNPDLFPSPDEFQPERWLTPEAEHLKTYIVNFTKGSRVCLGKELAHTEIIYALALILRRWGGKDGSGIELYETTRADVDVEHDFFNPFPRLDSKGVRVMLK